MSLSIREDADDSTIAVETDDVTLVERVVMRVNPMPDDPPFTIDDYERIVAHIRNFPLTPPPEVE